MLCGRNCSVNKCCAKNRGACWKYKDQLSKVKKTDQLEDFQNMVKRLFGPYKAKVSIRLDSDL